jgi:hypothetical protein
MVQVVEMPDFPDQSMMMEYRLLLMRGLSNAISLFAPHRSSFWTDDFGDAEHDRIFNSAVERCAKNRSHLSEGEEDTCWKLERDGHGRLPKCVHESSACAGM